MAVKREVDEPPPTEPPPDLVGRARLARERLGMNQAETAMLFDLRRATISDYERGATPIPLGYLSLLAGWFEDYWPAFRWLLGGGEMPRLEPWGLGTVRSLEGPTQATEGQIGVNRGRLAAWRVVEQEMRDYEQRGEAAPTAQLAHWIVRITSPAAESADLVDTVDNGGRP